MRRSVTNGAFVLERGVGPGHTMPGRDDPAPT